MEEKTITEREKKKRENERVRERVNNLIAITSLLFPTMHDNKQEKIVMRIFLPSQYS